MPYADPYTDHPNQYTDVDVSPVARKFMDNSLTCLRRRLDVFRWDALRWAGRHERRSRRWPSMVNHGYINMVVDGQWWLMMIHDGPWWLMMVNDFQWWLATVSKLADGKQNGKKDGWSQAA